MIRMRMEYPDQTEAKHLCSYLGLEIFLRRNQVTVVTRLVLSSILSDENLRDMPLPIAIRAKQEACSFFRISRFAVRVDLRQDVF